MGRTFSASTHGKVAQTVKHHQTGILLWFHSHLTNGLLQGINVWFKRQNAGPEDNETLRTSLPWFI
ncbi:hypothetical protein AV545_16680 [Paenibacillus jamilae]|uniref:transposase n=1 Tax=Paenibacillus jamilae TaxID=114136 RepID=UPI0007ABAE8D|nr:transposase [Paenibacillus jamilae]KZE72075.1 hypothetical protein AV545_16680 [Paenibacillus jamilae]